MTEEKNKKINRIIILFFIPIFIIAIIIATKQGGKSVTELNDYQGFHRVAAENETDGSKKNRVEYYTYDGSFSPIVFEELCLEKAKIYQKSNFITYNMVVFIDSEHITRSVYPIGAKYGDELDKLKYIKAFFTCTNYNYYSELSYYSKNAAESSPTIKDL